MKLVKLVDGVLQRFVGFALIKTSGPMYRWTPRYDETGEIYMWLREKEPT